MVAIKWEEYLWRLDKIIAVPPLNEGRIKLLDIFVQDGVAISSRVMRRIGTMITLGDMNVDRWPEERDYLYEKLRALDDPTEDNVDEPFTKDYDQAAFLNVEVSGTTIYSASAFGIVKVDFNKFTNHKIEIRNPFYQKVTEDDLIRYVDGGNDSPLWKPNLKMIKRNETKSRSLLGTDKHLELWIVTELKFASTIIDTSIKDRRINSNLRMQPAGVDLANIVGGLPVQGDVTASTSTVNSTQIEGNDKNILYGFKAVRVKFDEQGNFVSQKGMGNKQVHVTRAGEEIRLNPDRDANYHMGAFFKGEWSHDVPNDGFECVPLALDDVSGISP